MSCVSYCFTRALIAAALLAFTVSAASSQASFITNGLTGNADYDGWVNLKSGTPGLSSATLATGFGSNEAGSGDAALTRTSGAHFPASSSLYSFSVDSTFQLADTTALADVKTIVFSILTWPSVGDGSTAADALSAMPVLNLNGGADAIPADYTGFEFFGAGSLGGFDVDTYAYTFQWDVTSLGSVTSFDVDWGQRVHAGVVGLQLEQSDVFSLSAAVASVPEPNTLAIVGLVGCGLLAGRLRRRFDRHAQLS
jgi:hypothetical protein